jgi:hypothetical protein
VSGEHVDLALPETDSRGERHMRAGAARYEESSPRNKGRGHLDARRNAIDTAILRNPWRQ